jgi:hypothetical protein
MDSTGSGQGPVVGCCECGDEPSGSCATELVRYDTALSSEPDTLMILTYLLNLLCDDLNFSSGPTTVLIVS